MSLTLDIITITKDDADGAIATLRSAASLRARPGVRQIVVDSSTEPHRARVEGFAAEQHGVVYHWQEASGISNAFNAGLASSKADWVWFLNGRDEVHPALDPAFLLRLIESTSADALVCEIEFMQTKRRSSHPPLWKQWPPLYWLPHPATLMKRQLFDRFGIFDDRFRIGMDGELWLRVFSKQVVVDMLSVPITLYDETGLSSRTETVRTVREVDRMVTGHFPALFRIWLGQGFYLFRAMRGRLLGRWW